MSPTIGVLALQGAVQEHRVALEACGARVREVRRPEHLEGIDGIVLPGGESTALLRLLGIQELTEPLGDVLRGGLPALGTCAGMILVASEVLDGRSDQVGLAAIDVSVRRNAFGRQVASFEAPLEICGVAEGDVPFHGVFIRAPFVERVGPGVEVLAEVDGHPVAAAQGAVLVTSFHPELARDTTGCTDLRVHRRFLDTLS